jgi:hypothetical protein
MMKVAATAGSAKHTLADVSRDYGNGVGGDLYDMNQEW